MPWPNGEDTGSLDTHVFWRAYRLREFTGAGIAHLEGLAGAHAPVAETTLSVTYLGLNGTGRKARQKRRSLNVILHQHFVR